MQGDDTVSLKSEEDNSALTKMPLVGAVKSKTNFEWPNQGQLELIPEHIVAKLESISFKQGDALKAIRLNFTGGIESPLFQAEKGSSLLDIKTESLGDIETKVIRKVAFLVTNQKSQSKSMIWGLKFYDEEDEIQLHLNWLDHNQDIAEWVYQVIPEDKEIIGLYGRKENDLI